MTVDEAIGEIRSRGNKEPDWLLAMVDEIEKLRRETERLQDEVMYWKHREGQNDRQRS